MASRHEKWDCSHISAATRLRPNLKGELCLFFDRSQKKKHDGHFGQLQSLLKP